MEENKEFLKEKRYLNKVLKRIKQLTKEYEESSAELGRYIREERSRMWEDFKRAELSAEQMVDLTQITMTEETDVNRYYDFQRRIENMKKMVISPYFARLDFREEGFNEDETIYIGYLSLLDGSDVLICDWRADICSMYYESPLGKTFYTSQDGKFYVDLLLRRQFKIVDGKMEYMFDSDIAIEDSILKEELGKTADLKLKTIITTIQKEQNAIIRDISADLLLVQGVAGSGKTSVALHRLAYLLYKYRKSVTSDNIVIFSPNEVFSSYISEVLPNLGEKKVLETDFHSFLKPFLYEKQYEDIVEQNESLINDPQRLGSMKKKGSEDFALFLKKYFAEHSGQLDFRDISLAGRVVMTAEELKYEFTELYKNYTTEIRLGKISSKLLEHVENDDNIKLIILASFEREFKLKALQNANEYTQEELDLEKKQFWMDATRRLEMELRERLSVNVYKMYLAALKEFDPNEFKKTAANYENGKLLFEDMLCIAYLKLLSGQIPVQNKLSYVVVDEAQDYPPMLFYVLALLCKNAKFTILGDINQAMTPHLNSIKDIEHIFDGVVKTKKVFDLRKSYRSTVEINQFLNRFKQTDGDVEFLDRHGAEPEIKKTNDLAKDITKEIEKLKADGFDSNAVICRDMAHAEILYKELKMHIPTIIKVDQDTIVRGGQNVIIPIYLTKGLEFDGVIIPDITMFDGHPDEKGMQYVACSRALHRLTVFEE